MLKELTEVLKSELKCKVKIRLYYKICDEVWSRYNSLGLLLENEGLKIDITEGEGNWGPCLIFDCKGELSLLAAEHIVELNGVYMLPIRIEYFINEGLVLTEERQ